jgi:hypothetical protein
MTQNKGFLVALIGMISFFNFISGLAIIGMAIVFYMLSTAIAVWVAMIVFALFFGWMSVSVMQKFETTPAEMVWGAIVASSGIVLQIFLIGFVLTRLGPLLQAQSPDSMVMTESYPLMAVSLIGMSLFALVYIISFNFFTAQAVYRAEPRKLELYAYGLGIWIVLFFASMMITGLVLQTTLKTAGPFG